MKINPDFYTRLDVAEALIKVGNCKKGRRYALQALKEMQDNRYESIIRFLILSSYLIEGSPSGGRELERFRQYIVDLPEESFQNAPGLWNFKGLMNVMVKARMDLKTRFILHTFIDLLEGRIGKNKLSILWSQSKPVPAR